MPTIVLAAELRAILGVSSSLYNDAYLNDIIDTAENLILPMLVKYSAPIGSVELESNVATFYTVGEHEFSDGQQVVVAGVSATFNGTRTITEVSDDRLFFRAAITASDVSRFNVIPSGSATLVGAATYVGNPNVESAVLATGVEIFQSRTAAGGQIEGIDLTITPYRLGRSLFNRISGLLGPYLDVEAMIG